MNPSFLYSLTEQQKKLYRFQPNELSAFERSCRDGHEIAKYLKGTSMRFWYNYQGDAIRPHWHEGIELVIPLEGSYSVTVQNKIWRLEPGDIFIIPPGDLHALGYAADGSRFFFQIELEILNQIKGFSLIRSLLTNPVFISQKECPAIYETEIRLIMRMAELYWGNSPVKNVHLSACMMEFFASYGDFALKGNLPAPDAGSAPEDILGKKLAKIFDHIEHHYAEPLSLEEVAELSGFSKFYFTRLFKQYTGKTFYDYLTLRRLQEAERLLMMPELSVKDISARCGFSSVSSFNRTFKKWKNCAPTGFRKLHGSQVRM